MSKLKQLALSENEFTGAIPSSLATLPKLLELRLEGNKFTGNLPNFSISTFASFNVSNNELEGPIPATLSLMDSSSFFGEYTLYINRKYFLFSFQDIIQWLGLQMNK